MIDFLPSEPPGALISIIICSLCTLMFEVWNEVLVLHCTNCQFPLQGTVEERMEAVQARKHRMISGALTDQEVRTARIEELKMLFT